ncbi:ATP-binding protein [Variovorax robiniae]|uniref:ATP-binding protein n=1 Tax=Variovorax robiniae TaxID=1836199 RepID=A0ABU8XC61_9BURK
MTTTMMKMTATTPSNCATFSDGPVDSLKENGDPFPKDELQEEIDKLSDSASKPGIAERLRSIRTREEALKLPTRLRLGWFANLTIKHAELERVLKDVGELLSSGNGCQIIPIIGMTRIGKSTLMGKALLELIHAYVGPVAIHELPFLVVEVPSTGDHRRSWAALFHEILQAGKEPLIEVKKTVQTSKVGGLSVLATQKAKGVDGLRQFIKQMLVNRNIRVIVIDEAVHLKKYGDSESTMNALKSMASVNSTTKLLLLGSFDLLGMVTGLDQVVSRGSIVHFRRYAIGRKEATMTKDERAFYRCVVKLENLWPWESKPQLTKNWRKIGLACWGSIGALKTLAMRLLILQSRSKDGVLTKEMWMKASMPKEAVKTIEAWVVNGEKAIEGWEYGSGAFDPDELEDLVAA